MRQKCKTANKGNVIKPWGSLKLSPTGKLPEPTVVPYPRVTTPLHCSDGGVRQLSIYPQTHSHHYMRTARAGLVSSTSGFPRRWVQMPPGLEKAVQVFAGKSLWHRGGYQGGEGCQKNQSCLLHLLLIKANEK